jgi:hypothetical protein
MYIIQGATHISQELGPGLVQCANSAETLWSSPPLSWRAQTFPVRDISRFSDIIYAGQHMLFCSIFLILLPWPRYPVYCIFLYMCVYASVCIYLSSYLFYVCVYIYILVIKMCTKHIHIYSHYTYSMYIVVFAAAAEGSPPKCCSGRYLI